jgi:hypothetical protein
MFTEPLDSPASPHLRERLLIALAALLALALLMHGPIAQWPGYHLFADTRSWLGIPNAADVLSNLPFALIGAWGLVRLRGSSAASVRAWRLFCAALVCTAAGSVFYHWAPGNAPLVADRLPIAWACATLLCAFLAERLNPRWARVPALLAALTVATVSVLFWWFTEQLGHGDLRAYLFVQFLPMLIVPATLLLRLAPAGARQLTPASAWWVVLALYAAAKGMELADHAVFESLAVTSGHTLKHLLAAAAAGWIVRASISCGSPR